VKLLAFSVYDEKSGAFGHPFFVSAVGVATRMFGDFVNRKESPIGQHPEDYRLFQVGSWDDHVGEFHVAEKAQFIGHALDYVERLPSEIREVQSGRS